MKTNQRSKNLKTSRIFQHFRFLFSTSEAEKRLRQLMQEHKVIKQYLAIVRGYPKPDEGKKKRKFNLSHEHFSFDQVK